MARECRIGLVAGLLLTAALARAGEPAPRYDRRWIYAMTNLQVKEQADRLIDRIGQAKSAGYNGVVLADYKFNILDRVPDHYFPNLARVKASAAAAGVEIIPAVFGIGYSNGLLTHDPNLAEGLPVVDAPFAVKAGEARLVPDPKSVLANGDLEETDGDRFLRYGFQDGPGTATFADREVAHHGRVSCRMEDDRTGGNRRLIQGVSVRPHAGYRLSAWVKTRDLASPASFRLLALGASEGSRALTFFEGGIEPTQDWRPVEVVFNSLDETAVNLYVGLWGGGAGTLWIDEFTLQELGPVNILRRPGCPLVVKSADGATVFVEGRDYQPLADPKLGQVPYPGEFEFAHEAPPLRIPGGSRIRDGQALKVSWYHPVLTHANQVMICPSEEKTYAILRDQARRLHDLLQPRAYFMSHDEIRVMNWCAACQARRQTPGAILAENARRCVAILQEINPRAEAVVWSDMFDPYHNAVDHYYLVNGTLAGSWEGLPRSVTIANWNGGKRRESLRFFADRGHRQVLAGYYDAPGLTGFTAWDQAAGGITGVDGFMYTTWRDNYEGLARFGRAMRRQP